MDVYTKSGIMRIKRPSCLIFIVSLTEQSKKKAKYNPLEITYRYTSDQAVIN